MSIEIHRGSSETERLEMLLSALPIGIVIIDCNTRKIIDLNPQALAYFDLPLDQLVGRVCTDHICPTEKGKCPILDRGQTFDRTEREIITGDGSLMPVLKTVIKAEFDGKTVLIECIIDIQDKIFAQKERIEREKLQTVIEMAGAICHEFNQPLQVIFGFCELMKYGLLELVESPENGLESAEKLLENIGHIMNGVKKMSSLTRNLSNITKYKTKPYLKSKIMDIERSSSG